MGRMSNFESPRRALVALIALAFGFTVLSSVAVDAIGAPTVLSNQLQDDGAANEASDTAQPPGAGDADPNQGNSDEAGAGQDPNSAQNTAPGQDDDGEADGDADAESGTAAEDDQTLDAEEEKSFIGKFLAFVLPAIVAIIFLGGGYLVSSKLQLALHWRIMIGMTIGVAFGLLAVSFGWQQFTADWIKPFGTIFVNSLKLIAVPLIIASLIKGVSDLQDLSKLSQMGFRTLAIYIVTTVIAITVGLVIVNVAQPGAQISEETRQSLKASFSDKAQEKITVAQSEKEKGPLQPLVNVVPDNLFSAASSNRNMLQVIFFVIFFGIGLILLPKEKAAPVKLFFDSMNEVILKLIDIIMLAAPFGVFALLASLVCESPSWDILVALMFYALCVVVGLATMIFVVYPAAVILITKRKYGFFMKGISPAQLLAFSTSSSAATLPVTMERVEEHLGVDEEVSSFVLPIGATVNMDGTSLYQAVAAVFIAQATGYELGLSDQLTIVLTATLASIGSAAVPGAGMVMLVIVLEAIGIPPSGLALIVAVDRLLDMCRTSVNVTGDATVAMIVAKTVGKLGTPQVKDWDDSYPHKKHHLGKNESK